MTVYGMVYRDEQMVIRRHAATVGITGWSTVKGHCSVGLSRKFCAAIQVRRRLYSRDSLYVECIMIGILFKNTKLEFPTQSFPNHSLNVWSCGHAYRFTEEVLECNQFERNKMFLVTSINFLIIIFFHWWLHRAIPCLMTVCHLGYDNVLTFLKSSRSSSPPSGWPAKHGGGSYSEEAAMTNSSTEYKTINWAAHEFVITLQINLFAYKSVWIWKTGTGTV